MAKKQTLKVFRTPAGFHDAYVAAASQKAALAAWGSDADLFARGLAERVDDPALMKEPLARPGEVIKRLRGTAEEQIAALPPDTPKASKTSRKAAATPAKKATANPPRSAPKPRPSRAELDRAEEALEASERRQVDERRELDRRLEQLQSERRRLAERHEKEAATLEKALRAARTSFEEAMDEWRR